MRFLAILSLCLFNLFLPCLSHANDIEKGNDDSDLPNMKAIRDIAEGTPHEREQALEMFLHLFRISSSMDTRGFEGYFVFGNEDIVAETGVIERYRHQLVTVAMDPALSGVERYNLFRLFAEWWEVGRQLQPGQLIEKNGPAKEVLDAGLESELVDRIAVTLRDPLVHAINRGVAGQLLRETSHLWEAVGLGSQQEAEFLIYRMLGRVAAYSVDEKESRIAARRAAVLLTQQFQQMGTSSSTFESTWSRLLANNPGTIGPMDLLALPLLELTEALVRHDATKEVVRFGIGQDLDMKYFARMLHEMFLDQGRVVAHAEAVYETVGMGERKLSSKDWLFFEELVFLARKFSPATMQWLLRMDPSFHPGVVEVAKGWLGQIHGEVNKRLSKAFTGRDGFALQNSVELAPWVLLYSTSANSALATIRGLMHVEKQSSMQGYVDDDIRAKATLRNIASDPAYFQFLHQGGVRQRARALRELADLWVECLNWRNLTSIEDFPEVVRGLVKKEPYSSVPWHLRSNVAFLIGMAARTMREVAKKPKHVVNRLFRNLPSTTSPHVLPRLTSAQDEEMRVYELLTRLQALQDMEIERPVSRAESVKKDYQERKEARDSVSLHVAVNLVRAVAYPEVAFLRDEIVESMRQLQDKKLREKALELIACKMSEARDVRYAVWLERKSMKESSTPLDPVFLNIRGDPIQITHPEELLRAIHQNRYARKLVSMESGELPSVLVARSRGFARRK